MKTSNKTKQERISVKGKFLYYGNEKFYVKGVTYGTFAPDESGMQFPNNETVERDFAMMAAHGINTVRTYTVPPQYLLDMALNYNLKVMVGLPWQQHITFLDSKEQQKNIIESVRSGVTSCQQHPAILCYAIGNEIPAPIVRWHGKTKVEKFLQKIYNEVKCIDRDTLVTYVNYPTTEYLDLSFLDFDCFNVYLETPEKLSSYIARLHNLSGDRPLVLAEIGLDSLRNGTEKQAGVMTWQVETIFGKGCAGMFVFAWTDEWWRGGFEIEDWDFGLVTRQREPKEALFSVWEAFSNCPIAGNVPLPFFSVVICSYNGASTIRDTLSHLQKLVYPHFEILVINDGSTDNTANIVKEYNQARLFTTTNRGLSSARNTGMQHARGEIIAYIDDDAYPDTHWLHYLAYAYAHSTHSAMGGPNIIPAEDGAIAHCIANAPGGPVHVLETDEIAEHVPGCNLSVKKDVLMKIGGFDPVFRAAGDDVDVCWRIQEAGCTIGFHPSAVVWHHRRNSLKTYWKQQKGYGKAEALLEAKWPEKYNGLGHLTWAGRIYGNGWTMPIKSKKEKIFHGTWGTALFQSVYQPADGLLNCLPLMPEYYLLTGLFGVLGILGLLWSPLLWLWLVFAICVATIVVQAGISALKNTSLSKTKKTNWRYISLIIWLHVIQPLARLSGRLKHGLTPWRKRGVRLPVKHLSLVSKKTLSLWWEDDWKANETWLEELEKNIINLRVRVKRGGDFDNWDLQVRSGLFTTAKTILTIEEHGANKQYVKLRYWVNHSLPALLLLTGFVSLALVSYIQQNWVGVTIFSLLSILLTTKYVQDVIGVSSSLQQAFNCLSAKEARENSLTVVNKEMFVSHEQIAEAFDKQIVKDIQRQPHVKTVV